MPTEIRSRTLAAPAEELWEVIRDPHHLPRWWPRVSRVEDVREDEFTEVLKTAKGRVVRADFKIVARDETERSVTWAQQIEGTPFARVLQSAETEVRLTPSPSSPARAAGTAGESEISDLAATEVTIELRQTLAGFSPRFGLFAGLSPRLGGGLVRRAARRTVDEALDGLERIGG